MNFAVSRVLVPVDFSAHSDVALGYAAALASRLGAAVEILHVVEDPIAAGAWGTEVQIQNLEDIRSRLIEDAERRLDRCLHTIPNLSAPTVLLVRMGQPADTITGYAHASGIDLIVMGTHGRSGVPHLFAGSVAERVIRQAPCPVLTLRAAQHPALGSALGHLGTSRE